jgi:hypothetical protein
MSDYLGQGRVAHLSLTLCEPQHVETKVERQCSTHAPKPTPPESRRQDGVPEIFACELLRRGKRRHSVSAGWQKEKGLALALAITSCLAPGARPPPRVWDWELGPAKAHYL